ncbi:hypothetical protein Tsp_06474, partial [Trichinella spiralis]
MTEHEFQIYCIVCSSTECCSY